MAFIHRPERKKQMSVSATEKDTSLLLKVSTGKCQKQRKWGYTKEKEKKHFTLCYQSIQKYLGKATGFKHIDIAKQLTSSLFLHTPFSSGLIQQPKETVLHPPNSAGHGSSFQHEHQQRLPGPQLLGHLCSETAPAPAEAAAPPRSPWIISSHRGLPPLHPFHNFRAWC